MSDTTKMVRIEYEVPPLRMIQSVWCYDVPEMLEDEYREWFEKENPLARIRKFERGIEVPKE